LIFSSVSLVPGFDCVKMERAHRLLTVGTWLEAKNDYFWLKHWYHIAAAKVSLETKIAAYYELQHRGVANINNVTTKELYEMLRADRTFVAELGLDKHMVDCCRLCLIWIDDDVAALALCDQKSSAGNWWVRDDVRRVLMASNAPRCIRFVLQDKACRETAMLSRMPSLVQRLAEELVQPTDRLDRVSLIAHGQSVKLISMCVPDEELVALWLHYLKTYNLIRRGCPSVPLARKLHALATPDQSAQIKTKVLGMIRYSGPYDLGHDDDGFELVWLLGLVGPFDPAVQKWILKNDTDLFPAFTFAMIVAICDGYLRVLQHWISRRQRRFFAVVTRLPMDLQTLVALRLWGRTSTVIRSDEFDRALLAII